MSEKENFLTIKEAGQNELIIKKSRFIASFARTDTKEKAEAFVKEISKNIMMLLTIPMHIQLA